MPTTDANTTIEIYGISRENFNEELLLTSENERYIDLSSLDAYEYPYIKLHIFLQRKSGKSNPYISGISCDFIPTAELAVVNSKTLISDEKLMRGETVSYSYAVENISPRQFSEQSVMEIIVESENSIIDQIFHNVNSLKQNELFSIANELQTDDFSKKNDFTAVINDPTEQNEIYYFNNEASSVSFEIFEDNTPPWIEMTLDGILAVDGMFTSIQPLVEMRIFDDSRLPLQDIKYIDFRINGAWVKLDTAMLTGYGRQITEKSLLKFRTDTLEFGENLISVAVRDITGNISSFDIYVNVSKNGFIRNLNNYPNPFENETVFKFDYLAPRQGASAVISLYNSTGQKIRTLQEDISIGSNELMWDGLDSFGNSLPSGAYFYILRVETDLYVENNAGKVLIIK